MICHTIGRIKTHSIQFKNEYKIPIRTRDKVIQFWAWSAVIWRFFPDLISEFMLHSLMSFSEYYQKCWSGKNYQRNWIFPIASPG